MLTKYDFMTLKELWKEIHKRGYTFSHNRTKVRMRQFLIQDDIQKEKPIPYVECPNTNQTLQKD